MTSFKHLKPAVPEAGFESLDIPTELPRTVRLGMQLLASKITLIGRTGGKQSLESI